MNHQRLPFHRISQWTGAFFEESCLVKIGMMMWLGHARTPCPWEDDTGESAFFTDGGAEGPVTSDSEGASDEQSDAPFAQEAHNLPTGVPFIKNNKTMTTIVDKSGVHTHMVKYCTCPGAPSADIQLFQMGLFPASFLEPKTAFLFDVLDDFLLDNLECGTSAMNYYSKLRRMTTRVFPHLVPDRYRELMRVTRQWRKLKLLKWNGFSHEDKEVMPGDLALFCPACPQPGINVTLPTGDDVKGLNGSDLEMPRWLYSRSLVMDGNFKAEHLHAANLSNEVSLMDGRGFMVSDRIYKEHLSLAKEAIQRSECNNHRAVNQANATRHRLEATGIGGCACARHGCFVPHAMVDFQKGERQMNMNYALCEALKVNAEGICRALTFYDVNYQYHKHLKDRIAESPILQIHQELEIIPGIGLWHVHGHQDSCYVRYASNFIKGAGRIDGEIMETLWVPLNIISPSARGMGTPHRKECLDYQMNDCDFMKMIRMSKSLCRKYRQAVKGIAESTQAFQKLHETADPRQVQDWEAQERLVQARRLRDPTAMDIYEVQLQKVPTRKQRELQLLASQGQHPRQARRRGAATWLAEGLTIEEAQITLQMDWVDKGRTFLSDGLGDDDIQPMELQLLTLQDDSQDETDELENDYRVFEPEKVVIPLPSNLGLGRCAALGVTNLVDQELTLRQGQANDALHNIRVHLADKAVIFQRTVRTTKSQAASTRAWAQVHSVDRAVSINASIYSKCQSQLCKLAADDAVLERYQQLLKEHLKVSTAVADPNSRGQRNNMLAWFWSMDVQGDSNSSDWLNEFYRVHWLCAKALRDCWAEEMLLLMNGSV
ncbi:hypothetical protein F4604DRAFT_1994190 [Suillus subluteus]|nr:hypothetical protein F4604DRAFT_1994190 [Suillus subluteus]